MSAGFASAMLTFSRDGGHLVAADHDAITVTNVTTGSTCHIAIDMPHAVVGFVDQIWVVHGRMPELSRFSVGGARLAEAQALPGSGGELIAAPVSAPAALWTGHPAVVIAEDRGTIRIGDAPTCDLAVPLTARRWIVANGARVTVPSGLTCELAAGARVVAAAIVHDGTAVLALIERPSVRELALIGLSNGRLELRHPFVAPLSRIAARRGLIAARVDMDRIAVVELRSGRVVGELLREDAISDFALDPDGRRIALRYTNRDLELLDLREAFEAPCNQRTPVIAEATTAPSEPLVSVNAAPSASVDGAAVEPVATPAVGLRAEMTSAGDTELSRPFALSALAPIEHLSSVDRTIALELLDREMRTVALWTLGAIAEAWDSRRLGYGNEGDHPFEHEVSALLGMNTGFASEHVAAARACLAEHEAGCAGLIDARAPLLPLGALAPEFGLSPLALDILLVIAAPALWSEAARLFGILVNDPGRALVDEALVTQILAPRASRHDIAAELDPGAPLVRYGIVTVAGQRSRPFAGLTVDSIVLARLRRQQPTLGPGVVARGSDRALEELVVAPGVIADALAALARSTGHARIAVRGRTGSGRRTLLAAIAAEARRPLGIIDALVLPRTGREQAEAIRGALRRAQLAGLLPCIVGLEAVRATEIETSDALAGVIREHPGPIAVALPANEPPPFAAGHIAIDLPVLAEGARLALWRNALADAGLTADAAALASRYRIGPGTILRAISSMVSGEIDRRHDATASIDDFIRQTRDVRLAAHAHRVERLATWDSVVLPADIRDSLRELVARVRHRRTVFETWGMDRHVATSRGLTALFAGPPGTGKTLVAGVIARELGLDLYQVELSKLMSKWVGETERNLAAIFDAAEDGQVVLLFDEADSLFAKRTEVRSSNDRYANLEVNYLLQRLDAFEGIAILTTNLSGSIDPAFKRRLSFRLSFPFPDEDTREQLWRAHLPAQIPVAGPLALDRLAHKYQLSGGYIRNACLRAAFLAASESRPVSQHHLERAVALEYAELGKLSAGGTLE